LLIFSVLTLTSIAFRVWVDLGELDAAFFLFKVLGNFPIALILAAGSYYFGRTIQGNPKV